MNTRMLTKFHFYSVSCWRVTVRFISQHFLRNHEMIEPIFKRFSKDILLLSKFRCRIFGSSNVTECSILRKRCPYSGLFCSIFSRICTKCGKIRIFSPYSVRMQETLDQNKSEYGHFSRSSIFNYFYRILMATYFESQVLKNSLWLFSETCLNLSQLLQTS